MAELQSRLVELFELLSHQLIEQQNRWSSLAKQLSPAAPAAPSVCVWQMEFSFLFIY
jgi:hypothetical protein